MKCPFCGEEMRPGALQIRLGQYVDSPLHWVPPVESPPPGQAPSPKEPPAPEGLLGQIGRELAIDPKGALSQVKGLWKRRHWDVSAAVPLKEELGDRDLQDVMVSGASYLKNAWYCPKCEKALCVFQRGTEPPPPPPKEDTGEAGPPPPPPRADRRPAEDPWEEKGFFRRRKKPDWEK